MYFQKVSRSKYLFNPEKLGELTDFVDCRIKECMRSYKSKEETLKFIYDTFQIPRRFTRLVWNLLEKREPNYFTSYKILCEKIRNASSEAVTAFAQTTPSNVEIETSKSDEDLADASTSYTEPDNKPRARFSKAQKAKEQQNQPPSSPPVPCLTETALNDASPVEAASTTFNTVKNVSSKTKRRSKACKKVKQENNSSNKLQSNGDGKPCADTKDHKRQSSWEQVRGGCEQAEILQDLYQQVQQEMQIMEIPGNEGSDLK